METIIRKFWGTRRAADPDHEPRGAHGSTVVIMGTRNHIVMGISKRECELTPSINEVELSRDLITQTFGRSVRVEDIGEAFSWIEFPVRRYGVIIQIEDSAEIVSKNDIHVESACNTDA